MVCPLTWKFDGETNRVTRPLALNCSAALLANSDTPRNTFRLQAEYEF